METVRVSNYSIKIPEGKKTNKEYPMSDVFSNEFFAMFICAKRNSGKSVLIYNLLRNLMTRKTIIIFVSPTCNIDSVCEKMKKEFGEKFIALDSLEEDIYDENEKFMGKGSVIVNLFNWIDQSEKKHDYILCMDDSAAYLKDESVSMLLKNGRHYKIKTILSSQYFNDLPRDCRTNIEYYALFRGIAIDKLEDLYDNININNLSFEEFSRMYSMVTKEKYQFLFIDLVKLEYRKGLNELVKWNHQSLNHFLMTQAL